MKEINQELINDLLKLSEDDLYSQLGKELFYPPNTIGLNPIDVSRVIILAKKWMQANNDQLKQKICNSSVINKYNKSGKLKSRIEICGGILDTLLAKYSTIIACTLAILIFNHGLESYCENINIKSTEANND